MRFLTITMVVNVVFLWTGCSALQMVRPVHLPYAPYSSKQHNDFGVVYESEGRFGRAERQFKRAIRKDPTHAVAWTNYGNALNRRGAVEAARDAYRHALALVPGYGPAVNNLAMSYLNDPDADPHMAIVIIDAHHALIATNFLSSVNETRREAMEKVDKKSQP